MGETMEEKEEVAIVRGEVDMVNGREEGGIANGVEEGGWNESV